MSLGHDIFAETLPVDFRWITLKLVQCLTGACITSQIYYCFYMLTCISPMPLQARHTKQK